MVKKIKHYIKEFFMSGKMLVKMMKPEGHLEQLILFISFLFFLSVSLIFARHIDVDKYFSAMGFDTYYLVLRESGPFVLRNVVVNLRHPFFGWFDLPVILFDFVTGLLLHKYLFFVIASICSSFCGLLIFKVLKAVQVNKAIALLSLLLYYSFAYVLLLASQYDTFLISEMFLLLFLLYILDDNKNNIYADNLLFLLVTGTTSTNGLKILFAYLFKEKNIIKGGARYLKSTLLFFIPFLLCIPNTIIYAIYSGEGIVYRFLGDSTDFVFSESNKLQLFWERFLCEPIVFHTIKGSLFHSLNGVDLSDELCFTFDYYSSPMFEILIAVIYALVFFSVILNRTHILVKMFLSCFLIDVLICFGLGFGMVQGQIYCAHWYFFVPILIGLLLKRIQKMKIAVSFVSMLVLICISIFFYQNITVILLN